jgi:hypothetical protein
VVKFPPRPLPPPPPPRPPKNLGDVWVGGWVGLRRSQDISEQANVINYSPLNMINMIRMIIEGV